ncbi:MAG: M28 family peptidase [Candidatus Lokiarchaeota archaeon]|nr:M28 family peptidase [Candidatus Lokiarchaeota archaeon]
MDRPEKGQLYKHILKTEGVKHVLDGPEKLEECADYILTQFKEYGLTTKEQKFRIDGLDYDLRNIEAWIGEESEPQLIVASHYDTVSIAPGANDNGTAIAVMLETSRVLAQTDITGVRFVSFTLEEGNPVFQRAMRELLTQLRFIDETKRYSSLRAKEVMKKYGNAANEEWRKGKDRDRMVSAALDAIRDDLKENELVILDDFLNSPSAEYLKRNYGSIGSKHWIEQAQKQNREVIGMLCLETIGYTSKQPHSQNLPQGLGTEMFQKYNTSENLSIGDFIAILADKNSGDLAQSFADACEDDSVNLPYGLLQVPMGYDEIVKSAPDLLRSDHAPFWKAGIPALMLTDTANFRYPYYHTEADTINKIDFDFLEKIAKATIAATQNQVES